MTALVRGVAHHTTPCGPDTDRDHCPTNRRDGYAPTCGHPEADHHDHLCPEEGDVSDETRIYPAWEAGDRVAVDAERHPSHDSLGVVVGPDDQDEGAWLVRLDDGEEISAYTAELTGVIEPDDWDY